MMRRSQTSRKEHPHLMSLRRLGAAGVALTTAVLFTATTVSTAGAQKKKSAPAKTKPAPKPAGGAASLAEGKTIFMKNNCAACHAIAGTGGKTGTDLTHIGKTAKPADIAAYVRNPKKKKPTSIMPAYGPTQINDK